MEIPRILELAWEHAFPGREAAERNAILRELSPPMPREKLTLRYDFNWQTRRSQPVLTRNAGAARALDSLL